MYRQVNYKIKNDRNLSQIVISCLKRKNSVQVFKMKTKEYLYRMNIIVKRAVLYYVDKYPQAKTPLLAWYNEFLKLQFHNFNELKTVYGNASIVANNRVIFNIKGNDYRLIVSVNFKQLAAYIIWFGTHKEYDKIDTETIEFDAKILNYKIK